MPTKGTSTSKSLAKSSRSASTSAPPLTKEHFEAELRALAQSSPPSPAIRAAPLLQAAFHLTTAALAARISQLVLSPIFGSYPAATHHESLLHLALFLGWSCNRHLLRLWRACHASLSSRRLVPIVAAWIPVLSFWLQGISIMFGPRGGPLFIEVLTTLPLLVLLVACTADAWDSVDGPWHAPNGSNSSVWSALPGIASYAFFQTARRGVAAGLAMLIGKSIVFTRVGIQLLLAIVHAVQAPSKLLLWALPAILHVSMFNTHLPLPHLTTRLGQALQADGWTMLERRESLTGYMSVLEKENMFRVMRCDHSLLGGEWLRKPGYDGPALKDPIYGVFVMLEAVRLVERPSTSSVETALVM